MKKIQFLFFLIIINFSYSQNKLFLYDYRFIPDSTNKMDVKNEMMILNIQKDRTEFYSSERYSFDSIQLSESKKGNFVMSKNKVLFNDRIIKYPNSNEIDYITLMSWDKFIVKQDINLKWKLENKFSKILGYDVQQATTEFGGRKWIAWFAKEIPIQDGSYKFKDLPGLILKIEDSSKSHIFELKEIRKNENNFTYPDLKNNKEYQLNFEQYVKKFKNYRKKPTADLIDQIPDQRDAEGNFKTSAQIIKELNNQWLERFKKDNNLIEISLLK